MRTALVIIYFVPALCAVGAKNNVASRKTSLSESELRAIGVAAPDTKIASTLYHVAMATSNNVEREEAYLKSAAACLFACDKRDVWREHIKDKISPVGMVFFQLWKKSFLFFIKFHYCFKKSCLESPFLQVSEVIGHPA